MSIFITIFALINNKCKYDDRKRSLQKDYWL